MSDFPYCRLQVFRGNCRVAPEHRYTLVPGYFYNGGDRRSGSICIGIKGMPQIVTGESLNPRPLASRGKTPFHLRHGIALIGEHRGQGQAPGHSLEHLHQFPVERHKSPFSCLGVLWPEPDEPLFQIHPLPF
jgi:hypothetical protein